LNASIAHSLEFGDGVSNILLQADAFTGTNRNCDKEDFNYEVLADISNFVDIFGFHIEPFTAEILYGKLYGNPLANIISVSVLRDVIYYLKLEGDSCTPVVDDVFSFFTPNYDEKYTIWSFPVPLTFKLEERGIAEFGIGYELCDTELKAEVELDPGMGAGLDFFSEFELNSFRSGFSIGSSLAADLIPNSFVDFSDCKAGVSIVESLHPSHIIIDGEIQLRQCKWAHHQWSDCHWGEDFAEEIAEYAIKGYRHVVEEKEWNIPH